MPNPMVRVHDIESGETIDRPMTKEEFDDYKAGIKALEEEKAAASNSKALKVSAYEKLGLTAEEIAALLG
jgi:hypothetical protein